MRIDGNQKNPNRELTDFYPTDDRWTMALLRRVSLRGELWECAAGDDRMAGAGVCRLQGQIQRHPHRHRLPERVRAVGRLDHHQSTVQATEPVHRHGPAIGNRAGGDIASHPSPRRTGQV
jgi:hypothetical protein